MAHSASSSLPKPPPPGPGIVFRLAGNEGSGEAAQHAADLLGERLPMADVNVVDGGQPVYYYMISFE